MNKSQSNILYSTAPEYCTEHYTLFGHVSFKSMKILILLSIIQSTQMAVVNTCEALLGFCV